jgi:hypothetical protein
MPFEPDSVDSCDLSSSDTKPRKSVEPAKRLRELRRLIRESPDAVAVWGKLRKMSFQGVPPSHRYNWTAVEEVKALATQLYTKSDAICAPDFRPFMENVVTATETQWDLAIASADRLRAQAPPQQPPVTGKPSSVANFGIDANQPKARQRNKGGRPKVTPAEAKRRIALVAEWNHAKSAGERMKDFCAHQQHDLNDLNRSIAWAAQRRRRDPTA